MFGVLKKYGFYDNCISLFKQCVENNSFSVIVDGSSTEFFLGTRGLRQGDPISPALFVLAEEVLSRGISKLLKDGSILPYYVHKDCPIITHSLFTDDTIIFLNGRRSSLLALMNLLNLYQASSG